MGEQKLVGKTLHKDEGQNKFTYVAVYGIEPARKLAEKLVREAVDDVRIFNEKADELQALAHYIIEREY